MTKHYAYQHRPLSSILAPEAGQQRQASQTPDRDEKGRFVAEQALEQAVEKNLPEKYKGKTAEEIAEMHMNSEKRLGQIQNELGNMRGLVSDLAQVQRPAEPLTEATETVDVSGDDLINNPVETIRKVVQQDLNAVRAEQDKLLQQKQVEQETQALLSEYGDVETITSSTEFQDFATRTPSRQADLNTAAQGEGLEQVHAARRLLENWKDFQASLAPQSNEAQPTPVEQARAVANEGAGASGKLVGKDQVYEADVIALIQSDPAKYRSPSFQAELMSAIKEGRFVKQ
jgi:hypothetical protein